jgi:hypothetical protein
MLPDDPGSEATQASTDAEQTAQIKNLSRKVVWTWVVAAIGPLLALAGLVFAGLSWKASDGQLAVMKGQLSDARNGAAQARKDTDNVIAAADRQADAMRIIAGANKTMADAAKTSADAAAKSAGSMAKLSSTSAQSAVSTKQLADATSRAAFASQELAAAANDANAVSRELVKTTHQVGAINQNAQRAFVFVKGISLQKVTYAEWYRALVESNGLSEAIMPMPANLPAQQTFGWQANITWENSGSTPTKNLIISNNFWVSDLYREAKNPIIDVSAIPLDDKLRVTYPDQKMFIGPKQSAQMPATFFGQRTCWSRRSSFRGIMHLELPRIKTSSIRRMSTESITVSLFT